MPSGTDDFTISAWIKPTTIAGDHRMILASTPTDQLQFNLNPAGQLELYVGATAGLVASAYIDTNQWTHVVAKRINGNLEIYKQAPEDSDLVLVAAASDNPPRSISPLTDLWIGKRNTMHPFVGQIDDLRIYTKGLS